MGKSPALACLAQALYRRVPCIRYEKAAGIVSGMKAAGMASGMARGFRSKIRSKNLGC